MPEHEDDDPRCARCNEPLAHYPSFCDGCYVPAMRERCVTPEGWPEFWDGIYAQYRNVAPGPAVPPADETPFIIERCRRCDGFGDVRVSLSGRLHDYRVQPCGMCKGDGEIAVPNPRAA
jgi:hypothetical protein